MPGGSSGGQGGLRRCRRHALGETQVDPAQHADASEGLLRGADVHDAEHAARARHPPARLQNQAAHARLHRDAARRRAPAAAPRPPWSAPARPDAGGRRRSGRPRPAAGRRSAGPRRQRSASGISPGCTRSTRKRSTPRMRRLSSRPGRRASISSTGLAAATSGRRASVTNKALVEAVARPHHLQVGLPRHRARMPRPNSSSAAPWIRCTASPSATPSAIASSDSALARRRRSRLARKSARAAGALHGRPAW